MLAPEVREILRECVAARVGPESANLHVTEFGVLVRCPRDECIESSGVERLEDGRIACRCSGRSRRSTCGCAGNGWSRCDPLRGPSWCRERGDAELIVAVLEEGSARTTLRGHRLDSGDQLVRLGDGLEVFEVGPIHCRIRTAAGRRIVVCARLRTTRPCRGTERELRCREHAHLEQTRVGRISESGKSERRGRRKPARRVGRNHQVVAVTVGQDRTDVPVSDHEIHQRSALLFAHHVRTGVRVEIGIVVLEVAIQVDATRAVLVEEAVAIRIDALPIQFVAAHLSLRCVGLLHDTRVGRIDHVFAGGILEAHHGNHAVAIQVFRSIFVDTAVVVVVVRTHVPLAPRLYRREGQLGAIGIEPRKDVHHLRVQDLLDGGVRRIREQIANRLQRMRAADEMIALEIADHQHAGPIGHWRSAGIGNLDDPDVTTSDGRAE